MVIEQRKAVAAGGSTNPKYFLLSNALQPLLTKEKRGGKIALLANRMRLSAEHAKSHPMSPQNNIEENYKNFFKLYIKHKMDSLNASDSVDLIDIAQLCPFTDGDVIYQARAFYNSVYNKNGFFQDLCPQNMEGKSMETNPLASDDYEFNVTIYPNPNNGFVFILPNQEGVSELDIRLIDLNGKEIYVENLKPIDGVFSLKIEVADGTYLLYISNTQSGEYTTKQIIVKK